MELIKGTEEIKRLKINNNLISKFNTYKGFNGTCFNDAWNIDNNSPTIAQNDFLLSVKTDKHGMFNGRITLKDCKEYIKYID